MLTHALLIEVDKLLILGKAVRMSRVDEHEHSRVLAPLLHIYGEFFRRGRLGLGRFHGRCHRAVAVRYVTAAAR